MDEARNQIIYARPIRLSEDCPGYHGSPSTSLTHDGATCWASARGVPAESKLDQVDGLTKAGMTRTGWTFPIAAMICFGFFWFARTKIIGPLRGHARRVFRHPLELPRPSPSSVSAARELSAMAARLQLLATAYKALRVPKRSLLKAGCSPTGRPTRAE